MFVKLAIGKFDGIGILYYNNGDKYYGEFENDDLNGFGIKIAKNGGRYQGHKWKDGSYILY